MDKKGKSKKDKDSRSRKKPTNTQDVNKELKKFKGAIKIFGKRDNFYEFEIPEKVLGELEEKIETAIKKGNGFLKQGDSKKASGEFNKGIAIATKEISRFLNKGKFEEASGAFEAIDKAVEKGDKLRNQEEPGKASKAFQEAINTAVKNGDKLRQCKAFEKALWLFERAIEINLEMAKLWNKRDHILSEIKKERAKLWNKKAYVLYRLGRHDEALEGFNEVLKIEPSNTNAQIRKGHVLLALERYQEALKIFNSVLKREPQNQYIQNKQGVAYLNLRRYEDALKAFDRAITINQDYFDAWYNKGVAYLKFKKYEDALKAFDTAIEINRKSSFQPLRECITLLNQGKHEEALRTFNEAIITNKNSFDAWYNKGIALLNLGKRKRAAKVFEEAIRTNPRMALSYTRLGELFFESGDIENASQKVKEALENYKYCPAFVLEGRIEIERGHYDSAVESFEKAAFSDLNDPRPLIWIAYTKYLKAEASFNKDEKYREEIFSAIRALEKAKNLSRETTKKDIRACILYFLGYFYYKNKDIFAAKENLIECIELVKRKRSKKFMGENLKRGKPKEFTRSEFLMEERARELLKNIWCNTIKPSWWEWWLYSPFYRWVKRIAFALISSSIFLLLLHSLVPQILSFIQMEWPIYVTVMGLLILIIVSPNIESIRAKEIDIKLRSPPALEPFLSPSFMQERIGKLRR